MSVTANLGQSPRSCDARLIEIGTAALAAWRILIPDLIAVGRSPATDPRGAGVEVGSWSRGYHQLTETDQGSRRMIIGAAGPSW